MSGQVPWDHFGKADALSLFGPKDTTKLVAGSANRFDRLGRRNETWQDEKQASVGS